MILEPTIYAFGNSLIRIFSRVAVTCSTKKPTPAPEIEVNFIKLLVEGNNNNVSWRKKLQMVQKLLTDQVNKLMFSYDSSIRRFFFVARICFFLSIKNVYIVLTLTLVLYIVVLWSSYPLWVIFCYWKFSVCLFLR